jgi:thioredoxin 1
MPCRTIKPILEKLAQEYKGRVDLWQVNADESQELLRDLKVYGIPTLIVYRDGKEILRQVGAKPAGALKSLFESLATGGELIPEGLSNLTRFIRLTIGGVILVLGWANQSNWLIFLLGGIVMFTAVYDRCPIWRALTAQFKKLTSQA